MPQLLHWQQRKSRDEVEPVKPLKEETQHLPVLKTGKTAKAKPMKEIVCENCGKIFTAQRESRKDWPGKCKAAYYRK